MIDDYDKTLKRYKIEDRISHLTVEIKKQEKNNELGYSAAMIEELVSLQKKLSTL